jgi:exonuclease SbcC
MRRKVLEILGFNEPPGARSSSVIYRYAVFTPQEEMKEILRMKDDDRLQTLRKAFRIEDYKVARENADIAARFFRNRSFVLEDLSGELEELRLRMKERVQARQRLSTELEGSAAGLRETAAIASSLEAQVKALDALREKRDRLEGERRRLSDRLEQLDGWLSLASAELGGLRQDEQRLEALAPRVQEDRAAAARLEQLEGFLEERQKLEVRLARMRQELKGAERELAKAEERAGELQRIKKTMETLEQDIADIASVEHTLETYQADGARLGEKLEGLEERIREMQDEKNGYRDLEKGKKCPKCGQELSASHIGKVMRDLDRGKEELEKERAKLADRLKGRLEKLDACRKRLREMEASRSELRKLEGEEKLLGKEIAASRELAEKMQGLEQQIRNAESTLEDREAEKEARRLRALRPQWEERRAQMAALNGRLEDLKAKERQLEQRRKERDGAAAALAGVDAGQKEIEGQYDADAHQEKKKERENALGRIRFLEGSIEGIERSLLELGAEMARLEQDAGSKSEELARLARYREGAAWLSEFFAPALESIERHVLAHINCQFDELFRKWFAMLVEGTELDVTVDENFSPAVNQGGYELDIWALSGGEKTAVAFAYRLALNHMVREVVGADTGNLLILDEPTDGFSTEQLSKVREVLRELHAPQLILVSHERELEGFADHIFRVVKENGVSRVEPVAR